MSVIYNLDERKEGIDMFSPKLFTTLKNYSKEQFFKDLIAGIIVAIIALPLSIALAIASGVAPERGLYTAIVAGFMISFFGGSRVQIGGPTGAFMVIVYGIVVTHGVDGLLIATILAGLMIIAMGVFKLGGLIKFIPYPITTGFTSGIAVVIFSSQINDFLGLNIQQLPADFIGKWLRYFQAFENINFQTSLVGFLTLMILVFWPKFNKKIPPAIVAIVASVLWVQLLGWDVTTIGSKFGDLPRFLPFPSLPNITLDKIVILLPAALSIAILGSLESLLSAVVADGMIGGRHRSNTELIAQGMANIAAALFGGLPATGAIARTMANINNGGRTPVSGIVHAITLLIMMLILMPLAQMIPLSALAAILIVVAYHMSEWRSFIAFIRGPKSDVLILMTTFVLTVFVDLIKAIEIGMILSAFLFMKRMSDVSQMRIIESDDENSYMMDETEKILLPKNVQMYEINGPFFFGAADQFIENLVQIKNHTEILIIRLRHVPVIDATGLHAFKTMLKICDKKNIKVMVTGLNPQPEEIFRKSGLYSRLGADHFYQSFADALASIQA